MGDLTIVILALSALGVSLILLGIKQLIQRRSVPASVRGRKSAGPGPGFAYALVPPGGDPQQNDGAQGSWQWCLAFIPEDTEDGGSSMPPWWAPAPPWSSAAHPDKEFTREAETLVDYIEETSTHWDFDSPRVI